MRTNIHLVFSISYCGKYLDVLIHLCVTTTCDVGTIITFFILRNSRLREIKFLRQLVSGEACILPIVYSFCNMNTESLYISMY